MDNEFEKLICKTLEENPGAELKFTRRASGVAVIVTVEISGGGRWLECPMSEHVVSEVMLQSVETLRRARDDARLSKAAPEADYVPTEAERSELDSRTALTCRSCANSGVDVGRGRCDCLGQLASRG